MERSPALRQLARHLATLTLERIEELEGKEPAESKPAPAAPPRKVIQPNAVAPLRIGDIQVEVPVIGDEKSVTAAREAALSQPGQSSEDDDYLERTSRARAIDLPRVATRCRLKAESCRHQILRQDQERDTPEESESRQRMNDLIAQAKGIPDCFLWMFFRKGLPTGNEQLEVIARCYEAMAQAAELCQAMQPLDQWRDEDEVREALQLLSTTSSALRVALEDTWLTQPDIDQDEVHQWLKLVTSEYRYHVRKHMQLNDPADPQIDMPIAATRAEKLLSDIQNQEARREQAKRSLKKALYHAQKVRDVTESPFGEESPSHDCEKVNEAVEALVEIAPPELNAMLRQIAAVVERNMFPDGLEAHAQLATAWNQLDKLASTGSQNGSEPRERAWSDDVLRVRELLRGGQLVMIGGEPRREAIDRIVDAFQVEAVAWPELSEHGTAEPMRAPIAHPDTKLVAVLIKLTGHEHAERARDFAKQASVPIVHMPAGYNPEQIAAEVLKQVSSQLQSA
ncbi:MAG: hypothetical protein ACIAQU_11815 [Phycisphaerales bacterium JB064]